MSPLRQLVAARGRATLVAPLQLLLVVGLAAYAVHSITGLGRDSAFFEDWLYDGLLAGSAVLCLARGALVAPQRAAWLVLGTGLAVWSAGVIDTTLHPTLQDGAFPSRADVLWLAFYPFAYGALVLLLRARVRDLRLTLWLDGIVGALALAAVVAALAFPALVEASGGDGANVLADLAYPVADLVLAGFVLWVSALTGWRPGRVLGLVAVALLLGAFIDMWSLWSAVAGGPPTGTFDWLWPASAALLGLAAWQPVGAAQPIELSGLRPLLPPVVFAAASLGLVLYSRSHAVDTAGFALASATLVAVIVRMAVTFAENVRILSASRREALTDPLTALGNRRRLLDDLQAVLDSGRPHALIIFDLDGFKRFNDTFGHPAGDALLSRLGERLRDAVAAEGEVYRLGGDEFCALVRPGARPVEAIERAAAEALSERGGLVAVGTSLGTVRVPEEATAVSAALQVADERLYAHKGTRVRRADGGQTLDVLRALLREREPELHDHFDGVANLARAIGRRLGVTGADLDDLARAALLHDVGKVAIPDAILAKPGALDKLEWALMHEHTLIGERILSASPALRPVAPVVRASHERFDGRGYPDGISGERIPLAARVIAVCDAFDAMVSERPYSPPIPLEDALDELSRCAGTQFDPAVVRAFCAELAADRRSRATALPRLEAA
ncbi:MAG: diguanylate cyclase [Actinobacteria bacterium]|nr:MAG: diguanylate cyclase [Actinomycetota bacterium]